MDVKSFSSSDIAIAAMTLRRVVISNVTLTYPAVDARASLFGVMFYCGPLISSGDITEIMIFGNSAQVSDQHRLHRIFCSKISMQVFIVGIFKC